ncbi:NAD(P)/FAD-dependent oxidoreductase [Micromonospora sp. NPDC050495]|uniref:NAD(P)/FAD-dependent oxidoreductase n=1 Tax=Micromonospora sp. NPDC050495 TaxID=3154936 RepID=UPI0033C82201
MTRPHVVIVGAGFAGFHAARRLSRLARGRADITVVNPTDYFLYLPLLPEVTGGVLDPRHVAAPLAGALPGVRLVLGEVDELDVARRQVGYRNPTGRRDRLGYDRLVLAAGSVNKLLPIPGVADHAHGFRGIPEALYLRDHLVRQLELADATEDRAERAARCTFVVVGAGYTGTEVAAQGQLLTGDLARRHPRLADVPIRWLLLDTADQVLPGMPPRLSGTAARVLRERGVEVVLGVSVAEATATGVRLTDGRSLATHSLIWCVGVRPDPLVEATGLPREHGRLTVDEYLAVPAHPEILACGDAAAVPDPQHPGRATPMTAQHAVRQGRLAADNIAADYGTGRRRPYRHRDLGFVVDLGGWQAAAAPLQVPLSGVLARAVTRGYHLAALPAGRARVATDWLLNALGSRPAVSLDLVPAAAVPLETGTPETVQPAEEARCAP